MVFNETGKRGDPAETVLVNPRVVSRSQAQESDEEGCLSFPGLATERGVKRAVSVRVAAQGLDGNPLPEMVLTGWPARVFQHEYDHLEGTLLADRLSPEDLEAWRPTLVAWEEEFLAAAPAAEAAKVRRLKPAAAAKPAKAASGFGGGGGGGKKKR
jgi:peptide deformylase